MNRTQFWPYVQCPPMSRISLPYAQYINEVQYVLILKCHLAEEVFLQINVIKKEAQHITLCNTADLLQMKWSGDELGAPPVCLFTIFTFEDNPLRYLEPTKHQKKKKKILKLFIVLILLLTDYDFGKIILPLWASSMKYECCLNYFLIIVLVVNILKIAVTTYQDKQVSYRKEIERLFRLSYN